MKENDKMEAKTKYSDKDCPKESTSENRENANVFEYRDILQVQETLCESEEQYLSSLDEET